MIFSLNLPFYRRVRVWVGELPPCHFNPEVILEELFDGERDFNTTPRCLTLEVLTPKGARMTYGLLGADSTPTATDKARVLVNVSDVSEDEFTDSLASTLDRVRVGLPLQYAESVVAEVSKVREEATKFPAVEIQFKRAAYGTMGSDKATFRELSRVLTKLIIAENLPMTEAEMSLYLQFEL